MDFVFRVITANCGLDTIGLKACRVIEQKFKEDQADFYVINCQEVKYHDTLAQLKQVFGENHQVVLLGKMSTYTKGPSMGQGMASFMIHSQDMTHLKVESTEHVRRSRLRLGASYNKGALIVFLSIMKGDARIHIQTVSGHLDSTTMQMRAQDWLNIHQSLAKDVKTWEQLVTITPNLRLSGYDANTRDKIESHGPVNYWLSEEALDTEGAIELQGMRQAMIENQRYSHVSTYKSNLGQRLQIESTKRPGYSVGGTLDFVGVANGGETSGLSLKNVITVGYDENTMRDHDVIISPCQQYASQPAFDVVKGQMAVFLANSAPTLASEIKRLTTNDAETQSILLGIYQEFLGKNGLLNAELLLFKDKLNLMEKVAPLPLWLRNGISDIVFPNAPWFESACVQCRNPDLIRERQDSMRSLINALHKCKNITQYCDSLSPYTQILSKNDDELDDTSVSNRSHLVGAQSRVMMNRFRKALHRSTSDEASLDDELPDEKDDDDDSSTTLV